MFSRREIVNFLLVVLPSEEGDNRKKLPDVASRALYQFITLHVSHVQGDFLIIIRSNHPNRERPQPLLRIGINTNKCRLIAETML
jgi:hypothetical protein